MSPPASMPNHGDGAVLVVAAAARSWAGSPSPATSRSRTAPCSSVRSAPGSRWCEGCPTAPTWPTPPPPCAPWGPASTSTTGPPPRSCRAAPPGCANRPGPWTWGTRGPPCGSWPGWWPDDDFTTHLVGDPSLSSRPMDRVADPLRLMGAHVDGVGARCTPPLTVRGGVLRGIDYTTPMASAQVKSCVLLAGLGAEGDTVVREPVLTRRHTEELLARCGALVTETEERDGTHVVRLVPSRLAPFELDVPGDPSQAAYWVVAACVVPGSAVTVRARLRRGRPARLPRRAGPHGRRRSRRCPPPGPATSPPPPTSSARHGAPARHRGPRRGDHRPRRGPRPGRGGRVRLGRLGVPRRGGAPGEGVGPPHRGGRAGAGLRGPGRGGRGRPVVLGRRRAGARHRRRPG